MSFNQKVQRSAYCRNLYRTNKYECDVHFYDELLKQIALLELWEAHRQMSLLRSQADQIRQLTIEHSKSLDETLDEHHAKQLTDRIRNLLINLNTKNVVPTIDWMNSLQGKSLSSRVLESLEDEAPEQAQQFINRIRSNIHNEQLRTQCVLKLGIIKLLNGHKLEQLVGSYKAIIERAMQELRRFKGLLQQLPQAASQQVLSNIKFSVFVEGSQRIFRVTTRLYEALKVIDGSSNFKFKLNNLRTELNNALLEFNMKYKQSVSVIEESSGHPLSKHVVDLYTEFLLTKGPELAEKVKENLCFLCMGEDDLVPAGPHGKRAHVSCWNYMRFFTKK